MESINDIRKLYISEARLHNLCKVSGYFQNIASSLPRVADRVFEVQVPPLPGALPFETFTTGTLISVIYHLGYYDQPRQVANEIPLLEVLHAAVFLSADSWLISTLDARLNKNNISEIFDSFYKTYGADHIATKYLFNKFYIWFGYKKDKTLSLVCPEKKIKKRKRQHRSRSVVRYLTDRQLETLAQNSTHFSAYKHFTNCNQNMITYKIPVGLFIPFRQSAFV